MKRLGCKNTERKVMKTENVKESVENCMTFHARDWSLNKRDAWMYGIVCGWDDESMPEVAALHGWSAAEVERLRRLHENWMRT